MSNKNGLNYLFNYHRVTGITYFAHELSKKKLSFKSIILTLYNFLVLGIFIYNIYMLFVQESTASIFYKGEDIQNIAKRNVLLFVNNMGFVGFSVLAIYSCIFYMIKGNQIVDILKRDQLKNVSNKFEKRMALSIIFIQMLYSLSVELILTIAIDSHYNGLSTQISFSSIIRIIRDIICYFLAYNSHLTIISLIAYKSYIVSNELKNFKINIKSKKNIELMFEFIQNTQKSVKSFDKIINNCIFVTLIITSLNCLSLSTIVINPIKFLYIALGTLLESLSVLWMLCYVCDIIPKSFREFIYRLNDQFLEMYSISSEFNEYCLIINRIKEMKDEMCFTIFNQYVVNIKTFISCIAVITSYVVIIIQTNV